MAGITTEEGRLCSPSVRQMKFVKVLMETGDKSLAAEAGGYHRCNATHVFKRKAVQKTLEEALDRAGLTLDQIAHAHKELIAGRELKSDGTPKPQQIATRDGSVIEITPPPDMNARARGLDMIYKLRGEYGSEDEEKKGLIIRIQSNVKEIDVTPETKELNG